jgi:hypothetical protein
MRGPTQQTPPLTNRPAADQIATMRTRTVSTYEAKANFTRLLGRVTKGAEVIITKHENPSPGSPR